MTCPSYIKKGGHVVHSLPYGCYLRKRLFPFDCQFAETDKEN